jgi:hypothetical protein
MAISMAIDPKVMTNDPSGDAVDDRALDFEGYRRRVRDSNPPGT